MKVFASIVMLLTLLSSQVVFAHGDHHHDPLSEPEAQALALEVAGKLSSHDAGLGFGQLDKSWGSVPAKNTAIAKKGEGYYIVSVLNDSNQKNLFILMANDGEVYDANFSGEFEGIK